MFFGDLGEESCNLVSYFEARGAKHLNRGENPVSAYELLWRMCHGVFSDTFIAGQLDVDSYYF